MLLSLKGGNAPIIHGCASGRPRTPTGASWRRRVPCSQAVAMPRPRWRPSPRSRGAVFGSKRALLAEVIDPKALNPRVRQLAEEVGVTEDPPRRLALVA